MDVVGVWNPYVYILCTQRLILILGGHYLPSQKLHLSLYIYPL